MLPIFGVTVSTGVVVECFNCSLLVCGLEQTADLNWMQPMQHPPLCPVDPLRPWPKFWRASPCGCRVPGEWAAAVRDGSRFTEQARENLLAHYEAFLALLYGWDRPEDAESVQMWVNSTAECILRLCPGERNKAVSYVGIDPAQPGEDIPSVLPINYAPSLRLAATMEQYRRQMIESFRVPSQLLRATQDFASRYQGQFPRNPAMARTPDSESSETRRIRRDLYSADIGERPARSFVSFVRRELEPSKNPGAAIELCRRLSLAQGNSPGSDLTVLWSRISGSLHRYVVAEIDTLPNATAMFLCLFREFFSSRETPSEAPKQQKSAQPASTASPEPLPPTGRRRIIRRLPK